MSEDLSDLNLVELYDRLVVPDTPAPVSMWPQTAGWIWVFLGLAAVAVFTLWRIVKWRNATVYRRAALDALQQAGDDPVAIATILRRTALSAFPRDTVAGLHGADWLTFLDGTADGVRFSGTDAGEVLARAPYALKTPNKDLPAMAEAWIKTHRADKVQV